MAFQNVAASGGIDVAQSILRFLLNILFIRAAPLTRDAPRNTHKQNIHVCTHSYTLTLELCLSHSSAQQNTHAWAGGSPPCILTSAGLIWQLLLFKHSCFCPGLCSFPKEWMGLGLVPVSLSLSVCRKKIFCLKANGNGGGMGWWGMGWKGHLGGGVAYNCLNCWTCATLTTPIQLAGG